MPAVSPASSRLASRKTGVFSSTPPSFIDPPPYRSSTPPPILRYIGMRRSWLFARPALLHSDVSPHVGGGERRPSHGSALVVSPEDRPLSWPVMRRVRSISKGFPRPPLA